MSNTKRSDVRKTEGKHSGYGDGWLPPLPETPEWKHTRDKKRWDKPASWFKRAKEREQRAERNQEIKNLRAGHGDPDDMPCPKQPKSNQWDWT